MNKLRKKLFFPGIVMFAVFCLPPQTSSAQVIGVRTNTLAWGTYATINIGAEVGLWRQWSFVLDGAYNPFSWSDHKKTHLLAAQGEVRFWFNHRFNGHFIGMHGHWGEYDWGIKKYRYKGSLYGGGLSYGYSYMINTRWGLEGNIGFGLTHLDRDYRYDRKDKTLTYPAKDKNAWGISRAGLSIVYLIK